METTEVEKSTSSEDTSQLNRNRSFKSKQLVRSQAIRETHSPPRAVSPVDCITAPTVPASPTSAGITANTTGNDTIPSPDVGTTPPSVGVSARSEEQVNDERTVSENVSEDSSQISVRCSNVVNSSDVKISDSDDFKKFPVEIQITSGGWDESHYERQRPRRWYSDAPRDLLSNNPRVCCVCGACSSCVHCRGRRRRHYCPMKQDSGIVCSVECADCADNETGSNSEVIRKSSSLDADEPSYYCRCPEPKQRPKNMMTLSRNDSDDRYEPTGPELVAFIKDTLNKNGRDRTALLKIERELHALVNDTGRCVVRFPVMSSYGRMLVHRCAALFQLSHHLDQNNKTAVLVSKSGTSGGRIPCTSFKEWCTATFPPSPQRHQLDTSHAKSILKRDTHSLDEPGIGSLASNISKSLEQREREYERVRRRIFSSQEEAQWPWLASGPIKLLTSEGGRNKLLKVQSLESSGGPPVSWRGNRGPVSKSHSFGGYAADEPHQPRVLSKQGDLASSSWRLSPSSSGYKTLSLRSTDSVTPSPTGGASPEPAVNVNITPNVESAAVVWAVTDMAAVPAGAMVIHPQTGRPLTNPDGTIYQFDPANPPVLYDPGIVQDDQQNLDPSSEKRRGRLEKQHSFIDQDCECQPSEECRSKCCCTCRRHEGCQQRSTAEDTNKIPPSPNYETNTKNNAQETTIEQPAFEQPTNKNPEQYDETANQRHVYEPTTNQKQFEAQSFGAANQNAVNNVSSNQPVEATNEAPEMQYQYVQGYRTEEVAASPQMNHYVQQDMNMQGMPQNKVTLVPDPNIRPLSLNNMANMVYPAAMAQGYPYQCRVDPSLQMYQQVLQPEEQKLAPSPHTNDTAFRIDPSYPYAAVDYTAACGACVDTSTLQQQQRSYNVPYGQVEVPQAVLPPYQVGNVLLQQPHLQPYQYQEQLPWGVPSHGVAQAPKLVLPELYPIMQYQQPTYPHYNFVYPQVIPQAYPICQPVYPVLEKQPERRNSFNSNWQSKRNSISGSARNTPMQEEKVPYVDKNALTQQNSEIAVKIQQIKSQMAQLNTGDKMEKDKRRDEWRRRNSGNGLLGNYPVNNFNGRVMPRSSDDGQLSTAAQAIVESIRNMQAKNTYQDNRRDYQRYEHRPDRPEFRRRQDRDDNKPTYKDAPRPSSGHASGERYDVRNRGLNVPMYRPPYVFRQMPPGAWCRRSPGPVHPVLPHPRRPHPDTRNPRR